MHGAFLCGKGKSRCRRRGQHTKKIRIQFFQSRRELQRDRHFAHAYRMNPSHAFIRKRVRAPCDRRTRCVAQN